MKNKNSLQNVHKWYTNERYTGHYNKQKHEKGIVLDYTTCTWKEISKFFVEIKYNMYEQKTYAATSLLK